MDIAHKNPSYLTTVKQKAKILLVEDNEDDAFFIERSITATSKHQYELIRLRSAKEALDWLSLNHYQLPNLVLLDLSLPGISGTDLLRNLRETQYLKDLVVFVLSGSEAQNDLLEAYELHTAGFIYKHFLDQNGQFLAEFLDTYLAVVASPETIKQHRPMKILVIDDDIIDRKTAIRALQGSHQNMEVTEASCAAEATKLYNENYYDAVLLDYRLPDQDGIDLLYKLREIGKPSAIIMLSNIDDERIVSLSLEAGAQDFLLKQDVQARHLVRAITQARQRFMMESQLRQSYEQVRSLAEVDQLTGLANRGYFEERLDEAVRFCKRYNNAFALVLLDLDEFKLINDSYGHDIGDQLLQDIAVRLKYTVREEDIVCRLGGDEFAVLAYHHENGYTTKMLADRLIQILNTPVQLGDKQTYITASVGIAVYPDCADNSIELMKCADMAMYRAKKEGRNQVHFYSADLQTQTLHRSQIAQALRQGIEDEEFICFYQPQICGKTEKIIGLEALMRWQHPQQGLLTPIDFMEIAEDTGLIVTMEIATLRQACAFVAKLHQQQPTHKIRLAANLSAREMRNKNLPSTIETVLLETGLAPQFLELEITESMLITDPDASISILQKLTTLGVRLALDDFGTGYSSPNYLKLFPFTVMKIDRSFLPKTTDNSKDMALLKGLVSMGKSLGLEIVVEGIESQEQADLCKELDVDVFQGFLFSKPLSEIDTTQLLTAQC